MPEFIKAYIAIIFLSTVAFYFAKKATSNILPEKEFKLYKNSWYVLTSLAFLTMNYWLFWGLSFLFVAIRVKKALYPTGLYMAIIAAVPPINAALSGFGLINYLMYVDYLVMLSMALLLVLFIKIQSSHLPLGRVKTDIFVISYLLLNVSLNVSGTTFTDILRQSAVLFLSNFLPYYVLSRAIRDKDQLKVTLAAFVFACFPAALIGFFEAAKGWLLYSPLQSALKQFWAFGGYLGRDGALRASSSFGHSIAFGFVMAIGLGVYLYIQTTIKQKTTKLIGLGIMALGLIAPLSRGPWVGAAALVTIYLYLGKNGVSNLLKFMMGSLLVLSFVLVLPFGDKIINLIPFVGKTDSQNMDYRQQLLDASMIVIAKSPIFGNKHYADEPEMQKMIQGEKIIDLVNIYVSVLLNTGIVGLFLYTCIFISACFLTYRSMRKIKSVDYELFQIGRSLLSILIAIMLMISALSDQLIIPYLYYATLGISVAYAQIVKKALQLNLNVDSVKLGSIPP